MIRQLDSVGVIVARFQVANLHSGHRHLIRHVQEIHRDRDVLIVLGDHGGLRTEHDPLTFDERAMMIRENFPNDRRIKIRRLRDHAWSHDRWSMQLDELVAQCYKTRAAIMYGSRDSFLDVYSGKHRKQFVEAVAETSGTQLRSKIAYSPTLDARSAIIYAQQTRSPIAYSTADVAILDPSYGQRVVLMSKPFFDGLWAFPGGFFDPALDTTNEDTARRERSEEITAIDVGDFAQMGPRIWINDPRYRDSRDTVVTALFCTDWLRGDPKAGDDATDARWFDRAELGNVLVPWHRPLLQRLESYWSGIRH